MPNKTYITSSQAAQRLSTTAQTLRRWAKLGIIDHFVTPTGQFRFAVDEFVERNRYGLDLDVIETVSERAPDPQEQERLLKIQVLEAQLAELTKI